MQDTELRGGIKDGAGVGRCDISKWQRADDDTPQPASPAFFPTVLAFYESPVFAEADLSERRRGGRNRQFRTRGLVRRFLLSRGLERGVPQESNWFRLTAAKGPQQESRGTIISRGLRDVRCVTTLNE